MSKKETSKTTYYSFSTGKKVVKKPNFITTMYLEVITRSSGVTTISLRNFLMGKENDLGITFSNEGNFDIKTIVSLSRDLFEKFLSMKRKYNVTKEHESPPIRILYNLRTGRRMKSIKSPYLRYDLFPDKVHLLMEADVADVAFTSKCGMTNQLISKSASLFVNLYHVLKDDKKFNPI